MDSRAKFNLTMPANDLRSPISSPKEPPPCVQNAMFKERKPFTYTPGGLDLSEIRSEKMAKRLMRNAMSPGVQEKPKPPNFAPADPSAPKSSHYFNLPIAVFPCVQIPSNPKELLRRTSGPFSRSESVDQSVESPQPESPTVNGHNKKDELSKCEKINSSKTKVKRENKISRQESRTNKIKNEEKSSVENSSKIKQEEVKTNIYKSEEIAINNVAYEEIKSKQTSDELFINENNYEESKSENFVYETSETNVNDAVYGKLKLMQISSDNSKIKNVTQQTYSEDSLNSNEYSKQESTDIINNEESISKLAYEEEVSNQISSVNYTIKNNVVHSLDTVNNTDATKEEIKSNDSIDNMVYEEVESKETLSDDKCEAEEDTETFVLQNKIEDVEIIENHLSEQSDSCIDYSEEKSDVINVKIKASLREEQFNDIEEIIRIENNENEKVEQEISEEERMNESILKEVDKVSNVKDEVSFQTNDSSIDLCENINETRSDEDIDTIGENDVETYPQFETSVDADNRRVKEESEKEKVEIEIEDRVVSPVKAIKGLSSDLDSLPSLNICTKRFSFLRESPERDDEDDPFRIITGIPPKISLIDRVDNKRNCDDKKIEDSNKIINTDLKDTTGKGVDSFVSLLREDLRSCSPYAKEDEWKKDCLTVKDILEDPEPAWKIEMREISLRKAEAKEDSPLKEFELPKKEFNAPTQLPYQTWNSFTLKNDQEKTPTSYLPTWSQTLRPKSWKERNSDRPELYEWKKPDTYVNKFARNHTSDVEVRKTPEITVEVVNQPYGSTTSLPSNGYVYPWESSPESSVAFSPEPRTPTPQSRNSPFSLSVNSPSVYGSAHPAVISREYGTLGYQPSRVRPSNNRSCPIQSRSFKYLQLLTGTYENYEDDEPFIPQPAQHAYPRPGNF